ncbi:MAG: Gfo/Idh/MocA family protein [Candidatus Binatia bacterium]
MAQSNPLRVGLIGAGGRWGPRAHVPALQGMPNTELYAMCTAHTETAQAAANKFGVECAYGSDQALNADKRVEAVVVAVRVPAHYQLSKNAIEAGKHVFCEWPLGANTKEAEELAALARQKNVRTMVGLQRRASPAYLYMRELIEQGYVGQVLSVHMTLMNSGVLTRTSDRTWQRDMTLGANPLTITFGHVFDAMCMVVGELAELSATVSTQLSQRFETDTKKFVDVTSPDNIMVQGRLENGAVVNASCGVHPYHGSGHRFEIYGKEGTLSMIGGGEGGEELRRKILGGHKDDKALQELPVPERFKWVPQAVREGGASYDVGQMWVKFAEAIRSGAKIEADFEHAVRRHRTLDTIVRASQTGQRQKIVL